MLQKLPHSKQRYKVWIMGGALLMALLIAVAMRREDHFAFLDHLQPRKVDVVVPADYRGVDPPPVIGTHRYLLIFPKETASAAMALTKQALRDSGWKEFDNSGEVFDAPDNEWRVVLYGPGEARHIPFHFDQVKEGESALEIDDRGGPLRFLLASWMLRVVR